MEKIKKLFDSPIFAYIFSYVVIFAYTGIDKPIELIVIAIFALLALPLAGFTLGIMQIFLEIFSS